MNRQAAWFDLSAGVSGDMLLAALLDAGANVEAVRAAIEAVLPVAVEVSTSEVRRAGLRASKLQVVAALGGTVPRDWSDIRVLLSEAALVGAVRESALRVFARLAEAEARVHGIPVERVHFHEVGAVDSIADILGCCAALHDLGLDVVQAGRIALGSGTVDTEHGTLSVPVPAVLDLGRGWPVTGGGIGELATPTGLALITTLAEPSELLPPMRISAIGIGAGSRDPTARANVVRVVLGETDCEGEAPAAFGSSPEFVLEANVDDMDGRIWPTVLADLLAAGASDAWLSPILMKKGRPAHTLHVLAPAPLLVPLRDLVFERTPTIGVRVSTVAKHALPRSWREVALAGGTVRIKVATRDGVIVQATPEFDDALALAASTGTAVADVLARASAAAVEAGLIPGKPGPEQAQLMTPHPSPDLPLPGTD
jgi:uncharacterized protein (TIGR00299 family) protein